MRKNRRKHKSRVKCYRCVVVYYNYEFDGERFRSRTFDIAVAVDHYARFVQLLEDSYFTYSISRLSICYSPVNRDFYSLI